MVCSTPNLPNRLVALTSIQEQYEVLVFYIEATDISAQVEIEKHPAYFPLKDQQFFLKGSISVSPSFYLEVHQKIASLGVILAKSAASQTNVYFLDLSNFRSLPYFKEHNSSISNVSVFAFHPTLSQFAISAPDAPIFLANFSSQLHENHNVLQVLDTQLHWHAEGPSALRFTPDGLSLLSGGNEAVLVMWKLDTLEKSWVPRLYGPIAHISTAHDQSAYLLRYTDGAMASIDAASQKLTFTWKRGIKAKKFSFKPSFAPDSGLIFLPGRVGWVQIYDSKLGEIVEEFEPVKLNRVSDEEAPPSVDIVSLSPRGAWVVVAASINHKLVSPEIYLQVWARGAHGSSVLTTELMNSHPTSIVAVAFDHSESTFASISQDGTFKLWAHSDNGDAYGTWACIFQSHQGHSNPREVCYSADGSMICITYGAKVVLFDPQNLCILQYMACPAAGEFSSAQFIRDSPYLVALGSERVAVFNLLSGSVWWSLPLSPVPGMLLTNHLASTFSVIAPQDLLLTFDPANPMPLFATRLPFTPAALLNMPLSTGSNDMLAISSDISLVHLCSSDSTSVPAAPVAIVDAGEDSAHSDMFLPLDIHPSPKTADFKPHTATISAMSPGLGKDFNQALQIPSHIVPPVKQMLGGFMEAMFSHFQKPNIAAAPISPANSTLFADLQPASRPAQPAATSKLPKPLPTPQKLQDELNSLKL
ncbi:NET1-associated nuclear protein 1, variant 2 [Entomophthora muscae]|nr:NET1-associated nuclear protein 1, variant 2 [Entomophthora muscae]